MFFIPIFTDLMLRLPLKCLNHYPQIVLKLLQFQKFVQLKKGKNSKIRDATKIVQKKFFHLKFLDCHLPKSNFACHQ